MQRHCFRAIIRGRVQGVFFRESTRHVAQAHDICGYAHNLSDGRVEVVGCGDEQALQILQNWLHQGPQYARVDAVDIVAIDDPGCLDFTTG